MCSAHTAHMAFVAIMLWPTRPTNSLAIQDVCIIWPPECEIWNKCIYWVFVITILVLFVWILWCRLCAGYVILHLRIRSINKLQSNVINQYWHNRLTLYNGKHKQTFKTKITLQIVEAYTFHNVYNRDFCYWCGWHYFKRKFPSNPVIGVCSIRKHFKTTIKYYIQILPNNRMIHQHTAHTRVTGYDIIIIVLLINILTNAKDL